MAELLILDARPVFPAAEITAPDLRVWPIESPTLLSVSSRKGQWAELSAKMQSVFGLTLSGRPIHVEARGLEFVGTGPGAWLAIAADAVLAERLGQACEGLAAVADQSGAYGLLALEGAGARDLLARGAVLDLDARAFPEGAAATFSFGHFGAILWRLPGQDRFRMALSRSTGSDARRFLAHVAESLTACA